MTPSSVLFHMFFLLQQLQTKAGSTHTYHKGIRDHTSQGTTLWTPNNKLQSTMFKQQTQILCLLTTAALLLKWCLMMKILMTAPSVVLQLKHLFVFPVVPWPQLEVEFGAATWAYKSKPKVKSHLKRRCVHWAVQEGRKCEAATLNMIIKSVFGESNTQEQIRWPQKVIRDYLITLFSKQGDRKNLKKQ